MRPSLVITVNCLLAIAPVHASSLHSLNSSDAKSIKGQNYAGCYTEATNGRALSGSTYYNDKMTVEKCAAACNAYSLFGLEYGRECYCGNRINSGSVLTLEGDCNFTCPGNKAQSCGAGRRLDLYYESTGELPGTTASTAPVSAPTSTKFAAKGCYTEPTSGRALADKSYAEDKMTVEVCAARCKGFRYFGLESYHRCYCGHTLQSGSVPADAGACNLPCTGDITEICGGLNKLNLYEYSSPSTAAPSPISYAFQGCYTEANNSRALTGAFHSNDAMTVESCASYCSGYAYFGVEYGRECYCGNSPQAGSVITADKDCSFPCAGSSAEKCGAGSRLSLYTNQGGSPSSSSTKLTTSSSNIPSTVSTISANTSATVSFRQYETTPSTSAVVSSISVSTSMTSTTSSSGAPAVSTIPTAYLSTKSAASKTMAFPLPRKIFKVLSGMMTYTCCGIHRMSKIVSIHYWSIR